MVFISAMTGRGRMAVMHQVIDTYEKWCLRLSTARLNRWLRKVAIYHTFIFSSIMSANTRFSLLNCFLMFLATCELGDEQALLERSGCSTKGQVLHSSKSPPSYVCCLFEWEDETVGYRPEVLDKIVKRRLRYRGHSGEDFAAFSNKEWRE